MSKDTGGLAFPASKDICANEQGMTLRDYFAAKTMAALISFGENYQEERIARLSYTAADAMLAERSKP